MNGKVIFALAALLALGAEAQAGGMKIAVSIPPLAQIAKKLGGPDAQVFVILKPGQSPHGYEPTPGDMKKLAEADFVAIIGLGLDNWIIKMAGSAGGGNLIKLVDLSEGLEPESLIGAGEDGHDSHGGHEIHTANPHYWLDPAMMSLAAGLLATRMAASMDPAGKQDLKRRMAELEKELAALDAEIKQTLKDARGGYVAFHGAWDYFARRYGLNQVGVIEESPGKNPSARKIAMLVDRIKKTGAKTVMAEPQFSPRLAEALAAEAGVKVGMADPLGGIDGRRDYAEMMRYNGSSFSSALR